MTLPPRHVLIALAWCTVNLALCWRAVETRPFPWVAMLAFAFGPMLLFLCPKHIADRMHRGWMERHATDWGKPQSPHVILLLGWVALAVQTGFLLLQ